MLKLLQRYLLIALATLMLTGCAIKNFGLTIGDSVQGDYYLSKHDYKTGLEVFQQRSKETPENATANFYYGRFLLLTESPRTGLKYLKKANQLSPKNPKYLFWEAVAYAELKDRVNEEKMYRESLEADDDYLQSLVYLGHNLFERKKYKEALSVYNDAISVDSRQYESLYNRGLLTKKLKRIPEEKDAWEIFLQHYSAGNRARKAVNNLCLLGDFSYRNYYLGARSVTIPKVSFEPFSTDLTKAGRMSLDLIGGAASKIKRGKLQIIVYQLNNKNLARDRAKTIKKYLVKNYPKILATKVGVSWFSTPHYMKVGSKKVRINESVDFFVSKK